MKKLLGFMLGIIIATNFIQAKAEEPPRHIMHCWCKDDDDMPGVWCDCKEESKVDD